MSEVPLYFAAGGTARLRCEDCEDRTGTGPPLARTEVIYVDLGYWAISGLSRYGPHMRTLVHKRSRSGDVRACGVVWCGVVWCGVVCISKDLFVTAPSLSATFAISTRTVIVHVLLTRARGSV